MTDKIRTISLILLSILLLLSLTACGEAAELRLIFPESERGVGAIAYSGDAVVIIDNCFDGKYEKLSDTLSELSAEEVSAYVISDLNQESVDFAAKLLADQIVDVLYIPYVADSDTDISTLIRSCNVNDTDVVTVEGSMSFGVGPASVKLTLWDNILITAVNVGENKMLITGAQTYSESSVESEYDLLCLTADEKKLISDPKAPMILCAGEYSGDVKAKVYDVSDGEIRVFSNGKKITVEG